MSKETVKNFSFISFLSTFGFGFSNPIAILFFMAKGFTVFEAGLILAVMNLACAMFEIPTGAFADSYGRRRSAIVGYLLHIVFILAIVLSNNLTLLLLASILEGAAIAFESGAMESWAYDRLKEKKAQGLSLSMFSNSRVAVNAAMLLSAIAGGFAGSISLALPFIFGIPVYLACIYYVFKLQEKPMRKNFLSVEKQLFIKASNAFDHITSSRKLLSLFASVFLLGLGLYPIFIGWQPAFKELLGFGPAEMGFFFAAISIFAMGGNKLAERFGKSKFSLTISLFAIAAAAFLAGFLWAPLATLIAYLLMELAYGASGPITSDILHKNAISDRRATIASMQGLARNLGFGVAGLLFFMLSSIPLATTWMLSSICIFLAAFIVWKNEL